MALSRPKIEVLDIEMFDIEVFDITGPAAVRSTTRPIRRSADHELLI